MTTISTLFSRLALALALATGAGAALAVPASYHVTFDTTSLAGDGWVDLTFGGLDNAGAATAVVSNFSGALTSETSIYGTVGGDLTTTASFSSAAAGDLAQLIHLGGVFAFDVLFDYAATGQGITFSLALYDTDFAYLLASPSLATIELTPGTGTSFTTAGAFATVTELNAAAVPEPSQWLLMLTGLLLLGAMARRRNV